MPRILVHPILLMPSIIDIFENAKNFLFFVLFDDIIYKMEQ